MLELVFSQVGPWALVVLMGGGLVWLFAKGYFVPRAYLRELKQINATIWQAYQRECDAHTLTRKQNAELIELSRTSAKVLTAPSAAAGASVSVAEPEGDDGNAPTVA